MADFPPNLDDGELWLPSDIIPDEVSAKFTPEFPSELTYMEELAQQLSAYALLERSKSEAKPPPNLFQNFKVVPANQYGSIARSRNGFGFGYGGGTGVQHFYDSGRGSFHVGSRPVYQVPPVKSAHTLVESFVQPRDRVLQRQQNQGENRFFPFQVNGSSRGGFVRESGGTGVFFPRVAATMDIRKKQSVKYVETEQRHQVKKFAVKKQEVVLNPPPEKALPQDWAN